MDEAGGSLLPPSFTIHRSAGRVRSSPSSEPIPLRNLTLGVLIVTGGTLAALPFRRTAVVPDASLYPRRGATEATGPLQSALESAPVQVADITTGRNGESRFSSPEIPGLDDFISDGTQAQETASASDSPAESTPRPLTYDDLMAPIARPKTVRERYQAIAPVKPSGLGLPLDDAINAPPRSAQTPAAVVQTPRPRSGRLAFENRTRAADPDATSNTEHRQTSPAGGLLASSVLTVTSPASSLPRLPAAGSSPGDASVAQSTDARTRHWIVQP